MPADTPPLLALLAADQFARSNRLERRDRDQLRLTSLVLGRTVGTVPALLLARHRAQQLAPPPPAPPSDDDGISWDEVAERLRAIRDDSKEPPPETSSPAEE